MTLLVLGIQLGAVGSAHADGFPYPDNQNSPSDQMRRRYVAQRIIAAQKGLDGARNTGITWYALQYVAENPDATADQISNAFREADEVWVAATTGGADDSRGTQAKVYKGMHAVVNLAASRGGRAGELAGTAVDFLLDKSAERDEGIYSARDQVANERSQGELMAAMQGMRMEIHQYAAYLGANDPEFTEAHSRWVGARTGVLLTDSIETSMEDPDIANDQQLKVLTELVLAGREEDAAREAKKEYKRRAAAELHPVVDVALTDMGEYNVRQPVDLALLAPPLNNDQWGIVTQASVNWGETIERFGQAASVLGMIIGFVEPELGQKISTLGDATVTITGAITEFVPQVAGLGLSQVLTSAATLDMVGTVLGAVQTLMPLFVTAGPTPDQLILESVQALREQVAALGERMEDRFDRIDEELVVIYSDMLTQFDEVIRLGRISETKLTQVGEHLLELNANLDMWGTELLASLQEERLGPSMAAIDGYVHYADQHNGARIPAADYSTAAEMPLHYAAVDVVHHAPFVGPAKVNGAWNRSQVMDALNVYGANGTINYLDWYARSQFGWTGPQLSSVPSPAHWATEARAYKVLMAQNPDYHKVTVSPSRTNQILVGGQEILKANRSFSQPLATPRANGTRTNALFTGLTQSYKTANEQLSQQLLAIQRLYTDNKSYNLFGGVDQQVPAEARFVDPSVVPACEGTGPNRELTRPANVSLTKLPRAFAFAQYLGVENALQPEMCQTLEFVNQRMEIIGSEQDPTGYDTQFYADFQVTFKIRARNGSTVRDFQTWTKTIPFGFLCQTTDHAASCDGPGGARTPYEYNAAVPTWDPTGRTAFVDCTAILEDPNLYSQLKAQITQFLSGRQAGYYNRVATGLTSGFGSPLYMANQEVTKSARLLQAYSSIGWTKTLDRDALMKMALYGDQRIPGDLGGESNTLTRMFQVARDNYATCLPASDGQPCTGSSTAYDPLAGQDLQGGCPTVTSPAATADPVGNCILGWGVDRVGILSAQYEKASVAIATGTYAEDMAGISSLIEEFGLTSSLVHTS
ncbi:hypothetical protein [Streptomyces sp. NPDC051909]|uniref:hypothetical protein n=1 Tax=Streptomyces sp. NPDC051909 TaxID=3154944 RepID=UPI00341C6767